MGALNFIAWAFLIVFVIAPIAFFAIALLCQLVYNLVGMVLMILCTILRGILGMFGVACPEPCARLWDDEDDEDDEDDTKARKKSSELTPEEAILLEELKADLATRGLETENTTRP